MDAVIRRALPADARALTRVAHAAKRHWKYPEDWIGLTPAKSLTLRPLAVPDSVFADFLRGCIDGDGSVVVYADWYHTDKNERYVYAFTSPSSLGAGGSSTGSGQPSTG